MTATRELPDRPSLENLRKRAKALHRQIADGDGEAIARAQQHLPRLGSADAADVAAAIATGITGAAGLTARFRSTQMGFDHIC